MFGCVDCMMAVINDDYSGLREAREAEVRYALEVYPATIVFDTDEIHDFVTSPCDICESPLAGQRIEFSEF